MQNIDLRTIATFGVAGNFTGHLEQAGEAADFTKVKAAQGAPKAVFPTYIPGGGNAVPEYLRIFPFDQSRIIFPQGEEKLQIEPECAVIFKATWQQDKIVALQALSFAASNDCSIRKAGARKISEKKNWGPSSKGFSSQTIQIDKFASGGVLDRYRIASFLVREGTAHPYGEDSAVKDYSYIYGQLTDWLIERFNEQQDEGPAEHLSSYLNACGHPQQLMVSIGATRYTQFGQTNFLKGGDIAVVVLYPGDVYRSDEIEKMAGSGEFNDPAISVLSQLVVV